jgi:hypothetical protein
MQPVNDRFIVHRLLFTKRFALWAKLFASLELLKARPSPAERDLSRAWMLYLKSIASTDRNAVS